MKRICLLFVVFFCMFSAYSRSGNLTAKQETVLISNLNYLQYSISKIKDTDSRAVVDSEYSSIINNLDYSSLNVNKNDASLENYYQNFLKECTAIILNDNEKEFLKEVNKKEIDNAWKHSFSSMGSIFVPGQSIKQLAVSLVYTTVANIMAVEAHKSDLATQLEKDLFYLNQDNLEKMYEMQTNFFRTCINLLGGKEEKRLIRENTMAAFIAKEKLSNPKEIVTSLSEPYLKQALEIFPPYWYVLGNAYQQLGDTQNAFKAYDIFEKLKANDVMEKDETYIKVLKNKIQLYIEDDPSSNKSKILNCIRLINENTLASKIGEKKAYLGKIYFIIEEYEKALECISYIMNTSTENAEFLNDAINLKLLISTIVEDKDTKPIYEKLLLFDMINFGFNPAYADEIYDTGSHIFAIGKEISKYTVPFYYGGIKLVSSIINKFKIKKELEQNNIIKVDEDDLPKDIRDHLYFTIPDYINKEYTLNILIDDILYSPAILKDDGSYALYCLNMMVKNFKKEQEIKFIFIEKNGNSQNKVELTYKVTPIEKKIFEETAFALDRIGSDISAVNPQLAYNFGNYLHEENYKYNVKNIEKETEKIRKKIDKDNKDSGTVQTNEQKENRVKTALSVAVSIDTENLSSIFGNVADEFYKSDYDLFGSKFAIYNDDFFIIGLKSIYISDIDKKATFNSIGDVKLNAVNTDK